MTRHCGALLEPVASHGGLDRRALRTLAEDRQPGLRIAQGGEGRDEIGEPLDRHKAAAGDHELLARGGIIRDGRRIGVAGQRVVDAHRAPAAGAPAPPQIVKQRIGDADGARGEPRGDRAQPKGGLREALRLGDSKAMAAEDTSPPPPREDRRRQVLEVLRAERRERSVGPLGADKRGERAGRGHVPAGQHHGPQPSPRRRSTIGSVNCDYHVVACFGEGRGKSREDDLGAAAAERVRVEQKLAHHLDIAVPGRGPRVLGPNAATVEAVVPT